MTGISVAKSSVCSISVDSLRQRLTLDVLPWTALAPSALPRLAVFRREHDVLLVLREGAGHRGKIPRDGATLSDSTVTCQ